MLSNAYSEDDRWELRTEIMTLYNISLAIPAYRATLRTLQMMANPSTAIARYGLELLQELEDDLTCLWQYYLEPKTNPQYLTVRFLCYLRYAYCDSTSKLSRLTGIPKSTLCYWMKGANYSKGLIVAISQDYLLIQEGGLRDRGLINTKVKTNKTNRFIISVWVLTNLEKIIKSMIVC